MKKLTIILGKLISILFATSAPAQTPVELALRSRSTLHIPVRSPRRVWCLRQKWSINFGDFISYPIIADGAAVRVYVTKQDPAVRAGTFSPSSNFNS